MPAQLHAPLAQASPVAHATLHEPQCCGSVATAVQVWPQLTLPAVQVH
jgi:hypothetical protein